MNFEDFQAQHVELDELLYEEGLRDWFGKSKSKDGKKGWVNVVTGDSCASDKPGEGVPKCVSSSKRASMSKAERKASAAKKRREDPGQQSKSGAAKPTNVKTDVKEGKEEDRKDAMPKDDVGHDIHRRAVAQYNKQNPSKKVKVDEACWSSHKQVGMKKKGGKMVPDCVPKSEEVANTFAMYLVERGLNEFGVQILERDMGTEEFVQYAYDITESLTLMEGKRKGGASYEAVKAKVDSEDAARRKAKKGEYATTPSAKAKYGDEDNTVHDDDKPAKKKATVKKTKSAEPKKEEPKTEKRVEKVEKAEKKQPKKRPLLDKVAKHVLKGIERHNKAMSGLKKGADTAKKVGKGVGHVAKEFGKGVGTVGKAVKDTKKALTKEEAYELWMEGSAAWQKKEGKNPEGGLNEKGRKSYERENPGSDLKAPQPEGGPRKRSFCARMGGMKGPMKDEKGKPTRKALALRKWKC